MNELKNIFLLTQKINIWEWVITGLTEKKFCKKQKKDLLKKKLLSIIHKTKKQWKKSKKIDTKTSQQKKKLRLKSIKEKDIINWTSTKKKHYKINDFCFC